MTAPTTRQATVDFHFWLQEALKDYDVESFPKELLQNSDDAQSTAVTFVVDYQRKALWHLQDAPLTADNFANLGNFYRHSKLKDLTKIGKFGVGFCTVFHVSDRPCVCSAGRTWEMELGTTTITEGVQPVDVDGNPDCMKDCPFADLDTRAVFLFPFRTEPTIVGDLVFAVPSLAAVEASLASMFLSPALLFFLNSVRKIVLIKVEEDGTVVTMRHTRVVSSDLARFKAATRDAIVNQKDVPTTETAELVLIQRREVAEAASDEAPTRTFTDEEQRWWYCFSVTHRVKQVTQADANSPAAHAQDADPNLLVDVRVPVVLQLASPFQAVAQDPIISVGLPLTGIVNPLLCHCSASLELDARRVVVRKTPHNEQILKDLAGLYCTQFLRLVNPYPMYRQGSWPLQHTDALHQSMQPLIDNVLVFLATSTTPLFPVYEGDNNQVQATFDRLRFVPSGTDRGTLSTLQRLLLEVSNGAGARRTTGVQLLCDVDQSLRDRLSRCGHTMPNFDTAFCYHGLKLVQSQHWSLCHTTDEQRFALLRFILATSNPPARRDLLSGIELCKSATGWRSFAISSKIFVPSVWTRRLLLNSEADHVASEELANQFRAFPTPIVLDELRVSDLCAGNAAIAKRELRHAIATGQREAWVDSLFAFMSSGTVSESDMSQLMPLEILSVDCEAVVGNVRGSRNIDDDGPLSPRQPPRARTVPLADAFSCIFVPHEAIGYDHIQAAAVVAWEVGIPIIDHVLAPHLSRFPTFAKCSIVNVDYVAGLFAKALQRLPRSLSARHCSLLRDYFSKMITQSTAVTPKVTVETLPIYAVLGKENEHRAIRSKGQVHRFIVSQQVYDALPSSIQVEEMLAVPDDLAKALGIKLMDAKAIAESQLNEAAWRSMPGGDASRLQVFNWIKSAYPQLLVNLVVPTADTQVWKQVTQLFGSLHPASLRVEERAMFRLISTLMPSLLPAAVAPSATLPPRSPLNESTGSPKPGNYSATTDFERECERFDQSPMGIILWDDAVRRHMKREVPKELILDLHAKIRQRTPSHVSFTAPFDASSAALYTFFPDDDVRFREALDFYIMMTHLSNSPQNPYRSLHSALKDITWVPALQRVPTEEKTDEEEYAELGREAQQRFVLALKKQTDVVTHKYLPYTEGVWHLVDLHMCALQVGDQIPDAREMITGLARRWRTLAKIHPHLNMECPRCQLDQAPALGGPAGAGQSSNHRAAAAAATRRRRVFCELCKGAPAFTHCYKLCVEIVNAIRDFDESSNGQHRVINTVRSLNAPNRIDIAAIVRRYLPPTDEIFPHTKHRFVHPRCFIRSHDFDPFVPYIWDELWCDVYQVPELPSPNIGNFARNMRAWENERILELDLKPLTAYLKFMEPFLAQHDQALAAVIYLPNAKKVMRPATSLSFPYDPSSVRDVTSYLGNLMLHPDLCPDHFEFAALGLLGVQNIRFVVQEPIQSFPCVDGDGSLNRLAEDFRARLNFPSFQRLVQIAAHGGHASTISGAVEDQEGTVGWIANERIVERLRSVRIFICNELVVTWRHDEIKQDEEGGSHSVEMKPRSAIDRRDANFFIVADCVGGIGGGERVEELLRMELASCLCEFLALPPTRTRRELIIFGLGVKTAQDMEEFVKRFEPSPIIRSLSELQESSTAEEQSPAAEASAPPPAADAEVATAPAANTISDSATRSANSRPGTMPQKAAQPEQQTRQERPPLSIRRDQPEAPPPITQPPAAAAAPQPSLRRQSRQRRTQRPQQQAEIRNIVDEFFRAEQLRPAPATPPVRRPPAEVRSETLTSEQVKEGDACSICMAEFEVGDVTSVIECCHQRFHQDCLAEWMTRASSCPLCRADISIPPPPAPTVPHAGQPTGQAPQPPSAPDPAPAQARDEPVPSASTRVASPPSLRPPPAANPLQDPSGPIFDAPQRPYYNPTDGDDDEATADLPNRFSTTGSHDDERGGMLPDEDELCTRPAMNLVRCAQQRPGCCAVYTADGVPLPDQILTADTWAAVRGLSDILRDVTNRVDAGALPHCFIYYTSRPTPTVAFNFGGWLGFDVTYYVRDPRPFPWYSVFCHEYSHNNTTGHGLAFIHSLQVHTATVMASFSRELQQMHVNQQNLARPPLAPVHALPASPAPTLPAARSDRSTTHSDPFAAVALESSKAASPASPKKKQQPATNKGGGGIHASSPVEAKTQNLAATNSGDITASSSGGGFSSATARSIRRLEEMFPSVEREAIATVLAKNNGDVELSVDDLLFIGV